MTTDVHGRERKGDWLQTATGKQFFPLDPQLDDIDIHDIAAALSKQTRYAGHCIRFYSVAEHCVLLARYQMIAVDTRLRRAALLHDASEAYCIDVPRPLKPALQGYREIEDAIMTMVATRFDFDWPLPRVIKHLDDRILNDEREQNMATPPRPWGDHGLPLAVRLKCWTPAEAEREFLLTAAECGVVS